MKKEMLEKMIKPLVRNITEANEALAKSDKFYKSVFSKNDPIYIDYIKERELVKTDEDKINFINSKIQKINDKIRASLKEK